MTIYGYARVSTQTQKLERQIINIKNYDNNAVILQDQYSGVKLDRTNFSKLLSKIKKGDTIIFDSVSRMSRNAEEGFNLYEELFNMGVELVFLKESYINTATYKQALNNNIQLTRTNVDSILKGVNEYLMLLAKEQIKIAFDQSEKEVMDLRQRTKEGLAIAKLNGKQIGRQEGKKINTKKSKVAKEVILKHSKKFGGTLSDKDVMVLAGLAKATFYTYIKELQNNIDN